MIRREKALRILVVDDHPVVREGIRMCLKDRSDLRIVGEAEDGVQAVEQVRLSNPDVVLLDLSMPRMGGLDALPGLRKARPRARVIVLTVHNGREYIQAAMAAKVDGYLLKETAPAEYVEAIRRVAAGKFFISGAVAQHAEAKETKRKSPLLGLTKRELQYLSLAARGLRPAKIATVMNCAELTVRGYRKIVLHKLNLTNMAELTRFALENGI